METTKQYIKNVIKAQYPSLDISEGSPLSELFVNPSSAIFDPALTQINYLLDNLGLKDPEQIHPLELEAITSNFLIYRNLGIPSTGYVELFYGTAQSLLIPVGTKFTTADGTEFITTTAIQISSTAMANNTWRFPLYSTGQVPVSAVLTSTLAIGPEEIVDTDFSPAPVLVTNSTGFSISTVTETNTELAARLIKAVLNRSLASAASIDALLTENFPSIRQTLVIGPTDERMTRDLFESGIEALQNYKVVDFRGKVGASVDALDVIANFDQYPYPRSKAYWTLFYDDPTTSGMEADLPQPNEFLLEFSTDLYSSLYYSDDVLKATLSTTIILDEPFTGTVFASKWIRGDAHFGPTQLKNANELVQTVTGARLGYTPNAQTIEATPVSLSRAFLRVLKSAIVKAVALGPQGSVGFNPNLVASNINEELGIF